MPLNRSNNKNDFLDTQKANAKAVREAEDKLAKESKVNPVPPKNKKPRQN